MSYRSILAETVTLVGHNGDSGEAYYARPMATQLSPHISISATVREAPTTSAQEYGPRAV
jgi:hypothetical protein